MEFAHPNGHGQNCGSHMKPLGLLIWSATGKRTKRLTVDATRWRHKQSIFCEYNIILQIFFKHPHGKNSFRIKAQTTGGYFTTVFLTV